MTNLIPTGLSIADYADFCALPENAGRIFELVDGEPIEKEMPSFIPSQISIFIAYFIMGYLQKNPIGYVTGEQGGYRLDDHTLLIPDVGYISKARLTTMPEREVPIHPDLAVEVKSPTDGKRQLRQKAERYLASGTRMVWLVFPDEQLVEVYTPESDVREVGIEGILQGGDVLPDFALAVKACFQQA